MTTPELDPDAVRALRELYRSLPSLECRQRCGHSCRTRIGMSATERARIERAVAAELPAWMSRQVGLMCPLLSSDGRCSVYGLRPMICRLWGLTEAMRCPHGCVPDSGRWFTDLEMMDLLLRSFEVGGGMEGSGHIRTLLTATADQPELYEQLLAGDVEAGHALVDLGRRRAPGLGSTCSD